MKFVRKSIFIIFLFAVIIFFNNDKVLAGSLQHYARDFEININADGSMEVVELWDVYVNELSTLYKEFDLDENKFGKIKDVSVKEISSTGSEVLFTNINQEMQKVTKNCYYALINSKGKFEIAWGTGLENSRGKKIYKIAYTVTDVVKTYNDCSDFGWKVIPSDHNEVYPKVTGNIYLPTEVKNINNLRAWAHGPLNGNINIQYNGKISFEVTDVYADEFVEIRVTVLEDIFYLNTNKAYKDNFNNILEEEKRFANEANEQREKVKRTTVIVQIIIILVLIFFILKLKKQIEEGKKELNKTNNIEPTEKYKYYRELPGKNMTAGDIGFIYYYKTGNFKKRLGRVFSANVLSLYLKKYINIFKDKKGELVIEINKKVDNKNDLERDELGVLNIFTSASRKLKTTFTIKEFKKYIKNLNSKKMFERFENLNFTIENNARNKKIFTLSNEKTKENYKNKLQKSYIMLIFMFLVIFWSLEYKVSVLVNTILVILLIIYTLMSLMYNSVIKKVIKRNSQLTQKGTDYLEKLEGLKRYIEDFSLLKEKETLDVVLWREYLICAVVFGVSEKVIKEIMEQIPEADLNNDYYSYDYNYFLYKETSNILEKVNRVQRFKNTTNSNYSSGEGYGGGFSSGDAGFGRQWK